MNRTRSTLTRSILVVPEEFDPHPAPKVEKDVDWDGDWQ